jgi:decaprenyl-phosphate phosphoribosyltransferase
MRRMKLRPYLRIARPEYWTNHVFILPGILLAFVYRPELLGTGAVWRVAVGLACACLVASSNYVLNEILDAAKDRFHPEKRHRPVASGQVNVPVAYGLWLGLAALGFGLAFLLFRPLGWTMVAFWISGLVYNVPPLRLKDVPYVDVLCESLNNPIRLGIGWFAAGERIPPQASILLAYWMFGAFLMGMKRFAEFRHIRACGQAAHYRKSFGYYTEERLQESIFFYGALFGMLSGFFMARYHVEMVLATPLVALAMAYYIHLGFKPDSPVQHPERLYRQKKLMVLVALAFAACAGLLYVRIPLFRRAIAPWIVLPEAAAGATAGE